MKRLTRSEKIRVFILFFLIVSVIFYIYNYFIKTAPVKIVDETEILIYKNVRYKFLYDDFDKSFYESNKCLGVLKYKDTSSYQIFTVKNDPNNDYLILEGFLSRSLYIKENLYKP